MALKNFLKLKIKKLIFEERTVRFFKNFFLMSCPLALVFLNIHSLEINFLNFKLEARGQRAQKWTNFDFIILYYIKFLNSKHSAKFSA